MDVTHKCSTVNKHGIRVNMLGGKAAPLSFTLIPAQTESEPVHTEAYHPILRALLTLTAVKTCDSCECCQCITDLLSNPIVKCALRSPQGPTLCHQTRTAHQDLRREGTCWVPVVLTWLATTRASKPAGGGIAMHALWESYNQSNTLHSPSNIIHTPSNILCTLSKILRTLTKILRTLTKILHTLSKILCTLSRMQRHCILLGLSKFYVYSHTLRWACSST